MAHVIFKHPLIRMDLMVRKKYWPKLVAYIRRCECFYEEENPYDPGNGEEWIRVKDVQSLRGYEIGNLVGLFYGMEWDSAINPENQADKFYICLNLRKRGKNENDLKDRKEAGPGCKSGAAGESAGYSELRPDAGSGGDYYRLVSLDADDIRGLEVLEADDDGDQ